MINLTAILISALVGIISGFAASKALKVKNGPLEWLIIGAVGTVFGYFFSWFFIQSKLADFALMVLSTFIGSCAFILVSRLMKK